MKILSSIILISYTCILHANTIENSTLQRLDVLEIPHHVKRIKPSMVGSIEIVAGAVGIVGGASILINANPYITDAYRLAGGLGFSGIGTLLIIDGVRRINGTKNYRPRKRF